MAVTHYDNWESDIQLKTIDEQTNLSGKCAGQGGRMQHMKTQISLTNTGEHVGKRYTQI